MRSLTALTLAAVLMLGACGGSTATDSKLELTSVGDVEELVATPP